MQVNPALLGLLLSIYSNSLYADYDVDGLQTLFTDKNQRTQIDAARAGRASNAELKKTSQVKVSGYVTRSNGKSVVWLNDKNTLNKTNFGDVRVHQVNIGKDKRVGLTVDGKYVGLKPGESLAVNTGKVKDSF